MEEEGKKERVGREGGREGGREKGKEKEETDGRREVGR